MSFKRAVAEFSRICEFESRGETPSEEDRKALLWIFYSIANAPLLAMDSTENARWAAIKAIRILSSRKTLLARLRSIGIAIWLLNIRERIIVLSEKDFMILLVDLFPGKTGEVRKYIKMAGYTDQDIHALVDRTVGRDRETEFLYKGRSKRR